MRRKDDQAWSRPPRWYPYSLRTRIMIILLVCTLIPVLAIGMISYFAISSILENKIERGIEENLEKVRDGLDGTLHNLDYASRQLSLDGRIGEEVQAYLTAETESDRYDIYQEIIRNMTLVNYTNPDLGIMSYYFPRAQDYLFQNVGVDRTREVLNHPVLASGSGVAFYGPHTTIYKGGTKLVLSVTRKTGYTGLDDVPYVYIETNFDLYRRLLGSEQYGVPAKSILVDRSGTVAFSEAPDLYPIGSAWKTATERGDYYVYEQGSEYGYRAIVAVDKRDFSGEIRSWTTRFTGLVLLSLLVSFGLGWLIWRTVYGPIAKLSKEIKYVSNNRFTSEIDATRIREFDGLLQEFRLMRTRILELVQEVEQKEKLKRHLEVEKLLYQINPHFMHNTLNSIQLIARMNGQAEIDRLVTLFTRVLHYNLGKEGSIVSIREELRALQDYVDLQRVRYDYNFDVRIEADEDLQTQQIPRFLMQPLVENALYHGLSDTDGIIEVKAKRDGPAHFLLSVKDNGVGMSEDKIAELLGERRSELRKVGLGIGLGFVNNMVKVHYGDHVTLRIVSAPGEGTEMSWRLPIGPIEEGRGFQHD
ncbi:histidine kinase [Cohnella sp. GCM10027633]|uniref:histidine kinase n=1 Tax=unclassified Cohnella TaxID=2636738 RepID=UPI00363A9325